MKGILLASALVLGIPVTPQQPPKFEPDIKSARLTDNLHVLEGAGGNVAAYTWDGGVLLVDDKIAPASPRLKAAVAAISSQPIRFVINTHWHPDHRGGNEALASDGSVIVAHENVRRHMSVETFIAVFDRRLPPSPPKALPIVTFTRDVTIHLGGEEISVIHVDPAHTDGDSFVFFRNANVLHMGDCYLNGSFPVVDFSTGGLYTGIIAAADRALEMTDARTRIIPGHGPVASREDLRQWREMLVTILERVRKAVAGGATLDQVKAARPAKEWEDRLPASFVTSDHVVEEAYRVVTVRE
jgi:glyoxylase-like metal-dependent hydrolase (beta-lactamase superfamily II)